MMVVAKPAAPVYYWKLKGAPQLGTGTKDGIRQLWEVCSSEGISIKEPHNNGIWDKISQSHNRLYLEHRED